MTEILTHAPSVTDAAVLLVQLTQEADGLPRIATWRIKNYASESAHITGQIWAGSDDKQEATGPVQQWADHLGGTVIHERLDHDPSRTYVSVTVVRDGIGVEIWTVYKTPSCTCQQQDCP